MKKNKEWFINQVGECLYRYPTKDVGGMVVYIKNKSMANTCYTYYRKGIFDYIDANEYIKSLTKESK